MCYAIPHRAVPASQHERALLERERAITTAEKLASKLQVVTVQLHQLSRASGRTLQRYVEQKRRADELEAALCAAESRPHRMARLLLAIRLMLMALERSRCPRCGARHCATCGFSQGVHRTACRVRSVQSRIVDLFSV